MRLALFALVSGSALAAAAHAQPVKTIARPSPPREASSVELGKVTGDPDQVICRRQDVTGSRLASTKACQTRRDWAARKREERDVLEKIQRIPLPKNY